MIRCLKLFVLFCFFSIPSFAVKVKRQQVSAPWIVMYETAPKGGLYWGWADREKVAQSYAYNACAQSVGGARCRRLYAVGPKSGHCVKVYVDAKGVYTQKISAGEVFARIMGYIKDAFASFCKQGKQIVTSLCSK